MTPPIIAPVLFAPEFGDWDAASTAVVSEALVAADVSEGRVAIIERVSDDEGLRGIDMTVGAGVMVNAE